MGNKEWLQVCSQSHTFHCTLIQDSEIGDTFLPVEGSTQFTGLWWETHLSFKKHTSVLKTVQGGPQSHPSGYALEVGRVQIHSPVAVRGHCSLQAGLWLLCIWYSVEHQPATIGQHPQHWIKTGTHLERYAPAQSPVCTQRPTKLLWRNVG